MTAPDDDHIRFHGHGFQDFCLFRNTDVGFTVGGVIIGRQRNTALRFVGQIPVVFAGHNIGPTDIGGQPLTCSNAVTKTQYIQTIQIQFAGPLRAAGLAVSAGIGMPLRRRLAVGIAIPANGTGMCGVTLGGTGGGGDGGFVAMLFVEDIHRIMRLVIGHGHIQRHSPFGCGNIAVLGKFGVHSLTADGVYRAVLVKPRHPHAVGRTAVFGVGPQRGRPDTVPRLDREGDGQACSGDRVSPPAGGVIDILRLQFCPQVGPGAHFVRQLLQMAVCGKFSPGRNDDIPGHIGDVDGLVFVNACSDVLPAHGDRYGQATAADALRKRRSRRNALIVMLRCFRRAELVGHGEDPVLALIHGHIFDQLVQYGVGDLVHALRVRMDPIRKHIKGHTAVAQVQILHSIMVADRLDYCTIFVQLRRRGVTGHGVGRHGYDLGIGIEVFQAQAGGCVRIGKAAPLGRGQVDLRGRAGRVKGPQCDSAANVISGAEEEDHIGRSVAPQILDAGQGGHGGIRAQVPRVSILRVGHLRTRPTVVDTQFGIQFVDDLHPPRFINVCQQIVLRIPGTVGQIEPVGFRDVSGKGGRAGRKDRDDFARIVRNLGFVGASVLPHLNIFHGTVGKAVGISPHIREHEISSAEPVRGRFLVCRAHIVVVHRADLLTIYRQPDHIGAVSGDSVFQSVGVGLSPVDAMLSQRDAVVVAARGVLLPHGHQTVLVALEDVAGPVFRVHVGGGEYPRTAGPVLILEGPFAFPLHGPGAVMIEDHRLLERIPDLAEHTVCGRSAVFRQRILRLSHAHKIGPIELPAVIRRAVVLLLDRRLHRLGDNIHAKAVGVEPSVPDIGGVRQGGIEVHDRHAEPGTDGFKVGIELLHQRSIRRALPDALEVVEHIDLSIRVTLDHLVQHDSRRFHRRGGRTIAFGCDKGRVIDFCRTEG